MSEELVWKSSALEVAKQFGLQTQEGYGFEYVFEDGLGCTVLVCGSLEMFCACGEPRFVIEVNNAHPTPNQGVIEWESIDLVHRVVQELLKRGWTEVPNRT